MEWRRLRQCVDSGVRLPALVESNNQNGLVVNLMGVNGFIPMRYVDKVRGFCHASPDAWPFTSSCDTMLLKCSTVCAC